MRRKLSRISIVLVLALAANYCAPKPPPNLYDTQTKKQYDVLPVKKAILALSQTAIALNKNTGPTHLKDADTILVRDFALQASASLDDYVAGKSTLSNVVSSFRKLLAQLSADVKSAGLKADLDVVGALVDQIPLQ